MWNLLCDIAACEILTCHRIIWHVIREVELSIRRCSLKYCYFAFLNLSEFHRGISFGIKFVDHYPHFLTSTSLFCCYRDGTDSPRKRGPGRRKKRGGDRPLSASGSKWFSFDKFSILWLFTSSSVYVLGQWNISLLGYLVDIPNTYPYPWHLGHVYYDWLCSLLSIYST